VDVTKRSLIATAQHNLGRVLWKLLGAGKRDCRVAEAVRRRSPRCLDLCGMRFITFAASSPPAVFIVAVSPLLTV
jgi:hypothetical protein